MSFLSWVSGEARHGVFTQPNQKKGSIVVVRMHDNVTSGVGEHPGIRTVLQDDTSIPSRYYHYPTYIPLDFGNPHRRRKCILGVSLSAFFSKNKASFAL